MIQKVEMYMCSCDHCDGFMANNDGDNVFPDKWKAEDEALGMGWREVDGKWYCPDCFERLFEEDEEGNITRKED